MFDLNILGVDLIINFFFSLKDVKVKVKQSHYRPGQALRVPEG
jgi:hypothetical protein